MESRILKSDIIAVIPAYNESTSLPNVISSLLAKNIFCIVVDDGSTDDTSYVAKRAGAFVITHHINLGQGAALQTGFTQALTYSPQVIISYDADGQFDPHDIDVLISPILSNTHDVVLGSRFLKNQAIPPLKSFVLHIATFFTRFTTGLMLTDTHNGLRAFSQNALSIITIKQPRMAHASEILHLISDNSLSYTEVPVTVRYTEYSLHKGQSVFGGFRILFDLFFRK